MPWFPTHAIECDGRPCRPGEGNLKGYRFWGQPYIHREEFVQAQSRRPPHQPEPWQTSYGALVRVARRVAQDNLVLLTAADWDYREIVLNWVLHARKLGHQNTVVLAMDRELAAELKRRGTPSPNPKPKPKPKPKPNPNSNPNPNPNQARHPERGRVGPPGRVEQHVPAAAHPARAARAA